jgi:hypothetical protein
MNYEVIIFKFIDTFLFNINRNDSIFKFQYFKVAILFSIIPLIFLSASEMLSRSFKLQETFC